MEAKHTATPWRATGPTGPVMQGYSQPYGIAVDGKAVLVGGCFGDIEGGTEAAKANAAFIVRACNAHDDLVAEVASLKESGKKIIASEMERTAEVIRLRDINDDLVKALQGLLSLPHNAEWVDQVNRGIGTGTPYGQRFVYALAALSKAGA